MFLISKYECRKDNIHINAPVNIKLVERIGISTQTITFNFSTESVEWSYKNDDQREQEYNWILSKVNAVKNTGEELSALDHL